MEFFIPPDFKGILLVFSKGRPMVFDDLCILVDDIEEMGKVRAIELNRFIRGSDVLIERPVATLYLPEAELEEFAIWGKRYAEVLPESQAGVVLSDFGFGKDFVMFFVGKGEDAKHFFNDSSKVSDFIISNLKNASPGEN